MRVIDTTRWVNIHHLRNASVHSKSPVVLRAGSCFLSSLPPSYHSKELLWTVQKQRLYPGCFTDGLFDYVQSVTPEHYGILCISRENITGGVVSIKHKYINSTLHRELRPGDMVVWNPSDAVYHISHIDILNPQMQDERGSFAEFLTFVQYKHQ